MSRQHFKIGKGVSLSPVASRPSDPENGDIIYNSTTSQFERYENGNWGVFGSGSGAINLIENGDAESNINIWTPYNDRIGTPAVDKRPTDGVGGTPTVTSSVAFAAPINGDRYFLLGKPSGDCQGQGWSSPVIDIPLEYRGKSLKHYLAYLVANGTFAASDGVSDGDVIVYWYDVSQAKLIESSNIQFRSSSTTVVDTQEGTFQPDILTLQVRMLIHIATQTTSNFELKVDSVMLSPQTAIYGTPVTSPIAFTPTGTWTNATYTGEFYTVGKFNYYHIRVELIGTPTGGVLNITLPHTIDTNDLATGTQEAALPFASGTLFDNGSFFGETKAFYLNSNTVQIRSQLIGNAHSFGQVTPTSPITFVSGDSLDFSFAVPIVGNSASVRLSEPGDTRLVAAKSSFGSASGTLAAAFNNVTFSGTISLNTHGAWNGTTFTVPVSGNYQVNAGLEIAHASVSVGNTVGIAVLKNGIRQETGSLIVANASALIYAPTVSTIVENCKVGDTITIASWTNGTTPSFVNSFSGNYVSIARDSNNQVLAQGEAAYADYYTNTAQSIPNNSSTIVNFGTKNVDNYGLVTTGASWKFVSDRSDVYQISGAVYLDTGGSWSEGESAFLIVYKNGSQYRNIGAVVAQATNTTSLFLTGAPVIVPLNAGDYIDLRIFQSSGGAVNLVTSSFSNWVSIKSVRG